jgi:hypothetical protein
VENHENSQSVSIFHICSQRHTKLKHCKLIRCLYECVNNSHAKRRRVNMTENRMLRMIFEPQSQGVTAGYKNVIAKRFIICTRRK